MKWISKILWRLRPVIEWIDHTFTIPGSIKKVKGTHYYQYRDRITKGTVMLTNIIGVGSNIINFSEYKHGALYYGKGLRTDLLSLLKKLKDDFDRTRLDEPLKKYNRILKYLNEHEIRDDICYVIEAVGKGVVATDLVTFMTTKDKIIAFSPRFTDEKGMCQAANNSLHDIGLPYDFGFGMSDEAKYCFEVCADAYESLSFDFRLERFELTILYSKIFDAFTSDTFVADTDKWRKSFLIGPK